MKPIEPAYIRYIFDELSKGYINSENVSELPNGLIGIYEEAFSDKLPTLERKSLLERFAVFAILKKEVSADFVADILSQNISEIRDFVLTFSSWFNSPESGKYQIYHERLRVFIIQRLSEKEINDIHDKIVKRIERSINEQSTDEFEYYGLEFLTQHYGFIAMINGDGKKLLYYAYHQEFWKRQIKISKAYKWTKSGLISVMNWASKYNEDEILNCGVKFVELHSQEQNSAKEIVELIIEKNIESVLMRIQNFGSEDKDGFKRKFTLYLLCLRELFELKIDNEEYIQVCANKILTELENLEADYKIFNWGEYFPLNFILDLACELENRNLNYQTLFKFTDIRKIELKLTNDYFHDNRIQLLFNCTVKIDDENERNSYISNLSIKVANELIKQSKPSDSLDYLRFINNDNDKNSLLINISHGFIEQNNLDAALSCISDIRGCNLSISNLLCSISSEFNQSGKRQVAFTILHQAMELAIDTSPSEDKIKTLLLISHEFFNQGEKEISSNIIKELLNDVRGFSKIILRISALCDIYLEMLLQSVEKEYDEVKIEFFSLAFSMESEYWKCKALNVIYCKLSGQGKLEVYNKVLNDLMYFADNIGDVDSKHTVLIELTRDFCSQGMLEIAEFVIQKALYLTEQMDCSTKKNKALRDISTEFARLGNVGDSISCAQSVSIDEDEEIKPPFAINALELVKIKKVDGALLCIDEISDPSVKCVALISISNELESQNNKALASELLGDAISCANRISDEFYRSRAYESIICALRSQRKFEDAISLLVKINHEETKYRELMLIFSELYFIGKKEEAIDLLLHSISVQSISCNESDKMWTLINICEELVNQGKVDLAFLCAKAISDRDQKFQTLRFISSKIIIEYSEEKEFMVMQEVNELIRSSNSESWMVRALLDLTDDLSKQEKSESALSKLNEAIEITRLIKDDEDRDSLMQSISFEIYKQNNLQDALKYIRGMSSPYHKTFSVLEIVQHLIENENKKVASSVIFGAHVYAREIIQDWYKDAALSALSSKYVRLGMLDKAYSSIMSMHENDDKNRSLFTFCSELIELGEIEYAISLEQRISKKSDKIQLKLMISSKCFKQGEKEKSYFFLQKAISSAHELRNIYEKNESFLKICMELFNQGKVSEAIVNSGIILNDSLKIDFLLKVSRDLHNQKMFESASLVINEAFLCVRDFFEETDIQISSFIKVADELKNQGNREMAMTVLRQAINDAMRIIDVDEKNYAFTHISVTLASRFGDWDLSEQIGLAITQISEKQDCFRQIANCAIANHSPLELLVISNHFKSNKAQHYFLRGWLENIKEIDCDKILILSSLRKFLNDPQAIEELLYKYALYKIFFDDSEIEENQLINSRIDIQWAIDVKQMA